MEKIDKFGMKSGIVKIIPPQEWKDSLAPLDEMVKSIKVREPIKQDIMGSNGTYRQVNILHQRTYNLPQWRQLCDQSEHQPPARRGERRANADKPKPTPRNRAAASTTSTSASAGSAAASSTTSSTTRRGRRGGRTSRKKTAQSRQTADDDTASVVSEPRPMTPESQRGDDERQAMEDVKTCMDTCEEETATASGVTGATGVTGASGTTATIAATARTDEDVVMTSVETDRPIKKEEDDDSMTIASSTCTDASAAPRRMGFTRQASAKMQSTSARRKYSRREGSAKIDEAAFKDWDYRMDVSDYTPERCEELERIYWKTLTYAPPLYGADLPGTLFDESTEMWNLNKLPNLLDVLGTKVPGVNTAYLYLGMWKATFAWHLEDVDLYSINYLHFGAPKQWYSISQGDARRFEAAMKNIWPTDAKACDQFLRHKAFLISPSHLQQHYNIRVNKCVSYPGEFVVTYPYGYHSGYNLGYNCAEAVNFALDSWLPMGKIAKRCECAQAQDSVWVDVYEIERKLRGIPDEEGEEEDYESDEDMDDLDDLDEQDETMLGLPTPPAGGRAVRIHAPNRKRKRGTGSGKAGNGSGNATGNGNGNSNGSAGGCNDDEEAAGANRKLKRMRMRLRSILGAPCCLCPNDIPEAEILPTDDGRKAHRMCALYLPETYIDVVDGKDVVTNIANISQARLDLRCMYCRLRKGACLQCSYKKCSRSYHATCAAAAGVFVEEGDVPVFGDDGTEYKEQAFEFTCRFQRTKRDKKFDGDALEKNDRIRAAAASLTKGSICQMQLYRSDIFAGVVVENRIDEEMLLLHVIPSGDHVEVEWKWLLLPDPADFRLPKASSTALPLPLSRKEKEELNAKKRPLPAAFDEFVDGYMWQEFHTCDASACQNNAQAAVDLAKPDQLWHYLGKNSTESKPHYTADPSHPVHNPQSHFLGTIPKPPPAPPPVPAPAPVSAPVATPVSAPRAALVPSTSSSSSSSMQPPKRPFLPLTTGNPTMQTFAPIPSAQAPVSVPTTSHPPPPPPIQTIFQMQSAAAAAAAAAASASASASASSQPNQQQQLHAQLQAQMQSQLRQMQAHAQAQAQAKAQSPISGSLGPSAAAQNSMQAPAQNTVHNPNEPSSEPRRSYSVIKPPYVPHTSPVTPASQATQPGSSSSSSSAPGPTSTSTLTPNPTPNPTATTSAATTSSSSSSSGVKAEKPYVYKPRKTSDSFPTPRRPVKHGHQGHHQHHHQQPHGSSSASASSPSGNQPSPFGSFFSMPTAGAGGNKFPQIQHPNLSHGYATVNTSKPHATAAGTSTSTSVSTSMSPPSMNASGEATGESKILPPPPPPSRGSQSKHELQRSGSVSGKDGLRLHSKGKSSAGAAALAAAAKKLHKRSASSTSSTSSFGFGFGLKGLTRPSSHTNYIGPPPPPSSTASSPYLSAQNLSYVTRPGSVSSYASYDSMMTSGPRMSPHSPGPMDASPFIGSPGPPMGAFDFQHGSASSVSYQHPGMRPQFSSPWQQSFNTPMTAFGQDMSTLNFSPPSPLVSAAGLPPGGLGAPASIIPGQFGGAASMSAGSPLLGSTSLDMSPPLFPESPMAMSPPAVPDVPVDPGTSQSPAEQLKQQLESISDTSLPSSYRLRCLHQPRRRHQSRSSLNRIFTSQLLDLNPT